MTWVAARVLADILSTPGRKLARLMVAPISRMLSSAIGSVNLVLIDAQFLLELLGPVHHAAQVLRHAVYVLVEPHLHRVGPWCRLKLCQHHVLVRRREPRRCLRKTRSRTGR